MRSRRAADGAGLALPPRGLAAVRPLVVRRGRAATWLLWACGAAAFPLSALTVPADAVAFPRILTATLGLDLWILWAVAFAVMTIAMLRLRGTSLRMLLVAQALAGLAFTAVHAMPSIDTYAYLGYGDLLLHGKNPWSPGTIGADDKILRSFVATWGWAPPASRYGPAFVLLEAGLVRAFGPASVVALVLAQRLLSLGAALAVTRFLRGPNARLWALNPFVLYYFVLQAHNDVLFLALVCAAARIRRPLVAGLLVGLAASVKIVAFAAAFDGRPPRLALRTLAAVAVAVALLAGEPAALDATGLRAQATVADNSLFFLVRVATAASPATHGAGWFPVLAVALAVAAVASGVAWRHRDAFTTVVLLGLLALPVFWPWYLGWALAASIARSSRATMRLVTALCAASFVLELPQIWRSDAETEVTIVFFVLVSFVVAAAVRARGRTALCGIVDA